MEEVYYIIIKRRKELMGIAIIMVLLYHLCCWPQWNNPLRIFGHWFIGVDLFLFLSGFGLCFSYEKNDIKTFYYHRFIRVVPLFWFYTLVIFISNFFILGNEYTVKQLFYNLTTLSFWINTGKEPNWYVSALIFFYLFFPVFYKSVKKFPTTSFLFYFTISLLILKYARIEWYHDCFISRIPIFVFGILYFLSSKSHHFFRKALIISLFFWNVAIEYCSSPYFLAASICPTLLIAGLPILSNRQIINKKINDYISCIGTYSYELFLSNSLTYLTLKLLYNIYHITLPTIILIYIICTFFYGFIFIKISTLINRLLKQ